MARRYKRLKKKAPTKRQERESYQLRLRREKCVHFNGTQNKVCGAGVVYLDLTGQEAGWNRRLPCIPDRRRMERSEPRPV